MTDRIYLLVQGMHLRADSIAYDVAFQRRLFESWGLSVEVFAETFDASHYPETNARPFTELVDALRRAPGLVIYHWVDGWREGDDLLLTARPPVVLRWHNNTPPWFFGKYSPVPTHKTVRGYRELLRVADGLPTARVWTNSEFSRRQLGVLGVGEERVGIVHPISAYLENGAPAARRRIPKDPASPLRLLFVGRIVPHKGHAHLIAAAGAVAEMSGRKVEVSFPGRPDGDMPRYITELRSLAAHVGVDVEIPGEVSHEVLEQAYAKADVFVALSEHEGFGLPVLEAMTRGLPVVGYRCAAVATILESHPLAVDELDPAEIARRVIAATDEPAGSALVEWQARAVLPRFTRHVIEDQIRSCITEAGLAVPGHPPSSPADEPSEPPPAEVSHALDEACRLPDPGPQVPRHLPRDQNPHFVTRYDLESYHALLRSGPTGDLRARALAIEFGSHRKKTGSIMGLLKTGMLRLQDGLIRTIELSHNDLQEQMRAMDERVDMLTAEIERLRGRTERDGS